MKKKTFNDVLGVVVIFGGVAAIVAAIVIPVSAIEAKSTDKHYRHAMERVESICSPHETRKFVLIQSSEDREDARDNANKWIKDRC